MFFEGSGAFKSFFFLSQTPQWPLIPKQTNFTDGFHFELTFEFKDPKMQFCLVLVKL